MYALTRSAIRAPSDPRGRLAASTQTSRLTELPGVPPRWLTSMPPVSPLSFPNPMGLPTDPGSTSGRSKKMLKLPFAE